MCLSHCPHSPRNALPLGQRLRRGRAGGTDERAQLRPARRFSTPDRLRLGPTHFTPKAKSIIFLYMDGGPSQVDTFDPKPRLNREHGEPIKMHARRRSSSRTTASPRCSARPGNSSGTAKAAFPSASCFRTSPNASMIWRSSARWSPTSPSTPTPICSCTPAPTSRASPASARG